MRTKGRVDENQKRIVQALRKAGASVMSLASVGNGCPDLLVYRADTLYLLEVKADKAPSRRRLTPHQVKFHKDWPVSVVKTEDEALRAIGAMI